MGRATSVRANARNRKPMLRRMVARPVDGALRRTGLLATTALVSCLWGGIAEAQLAPGALPTQGQVVAGQSTISQSGNQMTITQGTQRSIINWGTYDIGNQATVRYVQPNSQSISLNRVVGVGNAGPTPSQIDGGLSANGQVWIINRAGIMFGAGARIDVNGLVASTANIGDRAFMENTNGRFVFDEAGRPNAAIVNRGEITVRDAGIAAFVAPGVQNSGTISASLGRLGLASANTYTLDLYGDRLINIAVSDRVMGNAVDAQGNPVRAGVENTGRILADGGRVEVSANVARGVVDNVIRMGGVVQARSATVARNGDIILDGGDGAVEVTGQIDASGRGAGQRGGQVRVRGERITIAPTVTVDVSGDAGGGTILVGGGLRGAGPEPHAQGVSVAAGARLLADAINTGRGGTVVVWSDGTTAFDGMASARGGATSGNGGLIETSGHYLAVGSSARIVASAPHGAAGTWLLDPNILNVDASGSDGLGCVLAACNVHHSVVEAALNGTNVVLNATGAINVQAGIDASANAFAGNLSFEAPFVNLFANVQVKDGSSIFVNATGPYVGTGVFLPNGHGLIAHGGALVVHQNFGGSIQNAISALYDYDSATINVGVGTYSENIVVDRPVNLRGAQADTPATNLASINPATQTVINAGFADAPGIWVQSSNVTVNGFTVTGSVQAGIRVGSPSGDSLIKNTRILNNYVVGNGAGIVFQGGIYYYEQDTAALCQSWCGDFEYYPDYYRNTIIDSNRIERNNITIPGFFDVAIGPSGGANGYSAGNHGIVFAGSTENTLISRNLIVDNNGHGILIAGSSYGYGLDHRNMAIAVNRIVRPGEVGIQVGGEYFYVDIFNNQYGQGDNREGGRISGLLIVQNTIQNAFQCTVANACTSINVEAGSISPTAESPYLAPEVGLRGAINFDNVLLQPFNPESFNSFGGAGSSSLPPGIGNLISTLGGQGLGLFGAGVTIPDLFAWLNRNREWNEFVGYRYSQPSVFIGFNEISGRGYGVAIQNTVDLGDTVVYINNNHLAANDKGGLLFNHTDQYYFFSGYGSGSGSGSGYGRYCESSECESGRVIAAGNWWGDQHQNIDTSPANLGNLGPTFTRETFDQTGFRADIQGTGALPYTDGNFEGGMGGVIVSSWRIDGTNNVARLNDLIVNGQTRFGAGTTYPLPVNLLVGGQFAGYTPTNFVRVGDYLQFVSNNPVPTSLGGANPSEISSYTIWRGPGSWDPSGRITRGVSTIREPLPLLANLIGTTIPGGTDNGTVDVLPGNYFFEGSGFITNWAGCGCYNNPFNGVVLVDKNNLTIQATVFGVQTPGTPAGLIPGTAGAFSYNPDDYDGTIAGRAFPINDANFPTRDGLSNTAPYEANLWGGVAVVPNLTRGLIGALGNPALFGGEGSVEQRQALTQAITNAAATNNFTLSGMTIANGFFMGQLSGFFGEGGIYGNRALSSGFGYDYGYYGNPYMSVGVLLASGQNHVIRNNRILNYYETCIGDCNESAGTRTVNPQGYGYYGEGSIGVWIAPGDAVVNAVVGGFLGLGGPLPKDAESGPLPAPPATGSNTQILQNDIVAWDTAGIMVGLPALSEAAADSIPVTPATGVQILRNAITDSCGYYCFYGNFSAQDISYFGEGAAIVLGDGVGATIQNNWIRNNLIGIVNFSTSGQVTINENSFESNLEIAPTAVGDLPAILSTVPIVGTNNWFGPGQVTENFTNTTPAPDRFDHNPLLPGWQIGVSESTPIADPTNGRIPADGPFSFLANPFGANQPLGGLGGGPSLQDIAPAAGGQGSNLDQCAAVSGEQMANAVLGTFNLLNPAVYQQVIRCQQAAAQ